MENHSILSQKKWVEIQIDGRILRYSVEGRFSSGPESVLLDFDDDLLEETDFSEFGFAVKVFKHLPRYFMLLRGLRRVIWERIQRAAAAFNIKIIQDSDRSFNSALGFEVILERYHQLVLNDQVHQKILSEVSKGFPLDQIPIPLEALEEEISFMCGTPLTAIHPVKEMQRFFIRVVRPSARLDFNPPHRDVWLSRLKNAVNIYLPICGSNSLSALPLIPGSHRWKESWIERTQSSSIVNGVSFQVPAVSAFLLPNSLKSEMTRPNPGEGELQVFSPYLIHGGGVNWSPDQTRMSLEMRFWRKGYV